ncbi:MAG: TIGR00730 family Rossman fold protein [Paludibacteraceae bacterium]|nr:TIGR00730 family Rossman fold protein [Paludibacteraceae bacterium]MBO5974148.1 TIGR00730 family Rossman fold protein [Paludibacteraceae bacterium]MBO7316206.1 TIGR00730 family Rossman fold protein [Paludibacteraceae bacterium]
METIKTITVFCASSSKIDDCYFEEAKKFGEILAKENIACCNGAGSIGLMNELSEAVLKNGGKVIGVIPQFMCEMGWQHNNLTELKVVDSMHQRKQTMANLGDASVALAGGIGTLEELFEIITWKQLGLYPKPIVILNTNGFFDKVLSFLDQLIEQNFMREEHKKMWKVVDKAEEILPAIRSFEAWDNSFRKIAAIK